MSVLTVRSASSSGWPSICVFGQHAGDLQSVEQAGDLVGFGDVDLFGLIVETFECPRPELFVSLQNVSIFVDFPDAAD